LGGNPADIFNSIGKVLAKEPAKPASSKTLTAERYPKAQRKQVIYGPYKLQPVKVRDKEHGYRLPKFDIC
jgi:hypothetical protein